MKTPYYAVIFTTTLTEELDGYLEMGEEMETLAKEQEGFIGIESAKSELGITVSYWKDLESISMWRANLDHQKAQQLGKDKWYKSYNLRVAKVERDYFFSRNN